MTIQDSRIYSVESTLAGVVRTTSTVEGLWRWAKALDVIGLVVFIIDALAGLITLIVFATNRVLRYVGVEIGVAIFFGALILGLLFWLALHLVGLLLAGLGSTVYNTMVSAKADLITANATGNMTAPVRTYAPASPAPSAIPKSAPVNNGEVWYCPDCGQTNSGSALYCTACGRKKAQ